MDNQKELECADCEFGFDYLQDGTIYGRWLEPERLDGAAREFELGTVKNRVFYPAMYSALGHPMNIQLCADNLDSDRSFASI